MTSHHTRLPVPTLDHVVINAYRRLDVAEETYRRLGFHLTDRGYHNIGSMNHVAMFGTDYLELVDTRNKVTHLTKYPLGLYGLVFGLENAQRTYECLRAAGVSVETPVDLTRDARKSDGQPAVGVKLVHLAEDTLPYGRLYFCQHFARDLSWRDEVRHHPNGVVGIQRATIVEPDPAAAASIYSQMFGPEVVRSIRGGSTIVVGHSQFDLVTRDELERRYGTMVAEPEGWPAYMAALTFRTLSLAQTSSVLQHSGISATAHELRRLIVSADQAMGVLLEFIE